MKTITFITFLLLSSISYSQIWDIQLKNDTLQNNSIKVSTSDNLFSYSYKNGGYTEMIFNFVDKSIITRTIDTTVFHKIAEVTKLKEDYFYISVNCDEGYVCKHIIFTKVDNNLIILFEEFLDSEINAYYSKVKSLDIKQ